MITGIVNNYLDATIELLFDDARGQKQKTVVVIDTGFDGILILPLSIIRLLGLPFLRSGLAVLADGSESLEVF